MAKTKYNLKQHEDKYIHIPKVNLYPVIGLIIFVLLAIGNFHLFRDNFFTDAFDCNGESCNLIALDLIYIYPLIGQYILISLSLISLVAIFKGGYNRLKKYDEEGLISGLIGGLIGGLIAALIVGLIYGLIAALIVGLIYGLILGLIYGLIGGLIAALIVGLIYGLIEVFD